ncbi:N-acetylglucosamine-6-phosphate deacetylase [Vagococcus salmoninarum]|uniref:N-acetylglucosamine-6-phosphate deacetylase n=2 Tax=Vagococcus salmoninarum TaxID=2739 RepID=UPI003F9D39D4
MSNDKLIKNGRVLINDRLEQVDILIIGGKISQISANLEVKGIEELDVAGRLVLPGFIDIHTHGAVGVDMNNASLVDLEKVGNFFASQGVTAYLPTLLTDSKEKFMECLQGFKEARETLVTGAKIIGVHLEGPYLVPEYKGAMPEELLQQPSLTDVDDYLRLTKGGVTRMTVSAEISGMPAFIAELRKRGVEVSLGHSGADYDTSWQCIKAGATSATHTFNAMKLMHQHHPAISGAVLESDIYAEVICDGLHLHPGIVRILLKTKGYDRTIIVTDSMMAAGLPDGNYKLGVHDIVVKDSDAQLADGSSRAGSTLTMSQALKNLVTYTSKLPHQLVPLISENPAKVLGLDHLKGSIAIGKDGDLAILDDDLAVFSTISLGRTVYYRK